MSYSANGKQSKRLLFLFFGTILVGSSTTAIAHNVTDNDIFYDPMTDHRVADNDIFNKTVSTQYDQGDRFYLQITAGRAAWTKTDYAYEAGLPPLLQAQSEWDTINNSPSYGFEIGYGFPTFSHYLKLRTSLSYDDFYDFEINFSVKDLGDNAEHAKYSAPADSKIILLNIYADSPNVGSNQYYANFYGGIGIGLSLNRFGMATKLSRHGALSATVSPNTHTAFAAKFDLGFRIKVFYHTYVNVGNKLFYIGDFKSGTIDNTTSDILLKPISEADNTYVDEPYVGLTFYSG